MLPTKAKRSFFLLTLLLLAIFTVGYININRIAFARVSARLNQAITTNPMTLDLLPTTLDETQLHHAVDREELAITLATTALYERFALTMDGLQMQVHRFANNDELVQELFADYDQATINHRFPEDVNYPIFSQFEEIETNNHWRVADAYSRWLVFTAGFQAEAISAPRVPPSLLPIFRIDSFLVEEAHLSPDWHLIGDHWLISFSTYFQNEEIITGISTMFTAYVSAETNQLITIIDNWNPDVWLTEVTFAELTWEVRSHHALTDFITPYMLTPTDSAILAARWLINHGFPIGNVTGMTVDFTVNHTGNLAWQIWVTKAVTINDTTVERDWLQLELDAITGEFDPLFFQLQ